MRTNRSNRRRLNSSVSDNYKEVLSFSWFDCPQFEIPYHVAEAIEYLNTKVLRDVPAKVDDITADGTVIKVYVTYDMDDATGFQTWLDNPEDDLYHIGSLIKSTLKNWGNIKFNKDYAEGEYALPESKRRINSSRFAAFDKSGRVKVGYGLPEEMCQIIVDRQTGANYVCLTNNEVDEVLEILASLHYEDIPEFSDAVMSGKHPEVDIVAGFRY